MERQETKLSNSQVRKLGEKIRSEGKNITEESLVKLEAYRASYKAAIFDVFTILNDYSRKIRHDAITTYRIKRIESILNKLYRFNSMQLDRMGDIAGCRCILNSDDKVYKLLNIISTNFNIKGGIRDYKKEPQDDGYRSIHIYVATTNNDSKIVEIQIRTKNDHNWATLVEILDLLYDKRLKEGQEDLDFERFHQLMSKLTSLNNYEKEELIKIIHKHKIFDRLRTVFVKNYLKVRTHWLEIKRSKQDHFFIIEASKNSVPVISTYYKFADAEKDYFNKFLSKNSENIVLTYLAQPNFQNLETAYSNYTLTTHSFIEDYFKLINEVTGNLIQQRRFIDFYFIFCDYFENLRSHFYDVKAEVDAINEFLKSNNSNRTKIKHWKKDFIKRFTDRLQESNSIRKNININEPKWGLYWIIFRGVVKLIEYRKHGRLQNIFD